MNVLLQFVRANVGDPDILAQPNRQTFGNALASQIGCDEAGQRTGPKFLQPRNGIMFLSYFPVFLLL